MNLHDQLSKVQMDLLAERANGQTKDQDKINDLERQEASLLQQIMEAQQQNLQERVEQAKETGYLLDTLETSNGVKMIELSYSPENHELVAIAVQKSFLAQQDTFRSTVNAIEYELTQERILTNDLNDHIEQTEREMNQLRADKLDAESKRNNAVNRMDEMANELNLQADELKKLKEQLAGNIIPLAPLSAEEQETKLINELNGKRIKVINFRKKSDEFSNKMFIATNALTGIEFEDYIIYGKRYEEISEEAAQQLRTDYANKKAEIEAQNMVIPIAPLPEPHIEPVSEVVEAAENIPFTPEEVQTTDNGAIEEATGDTDLVQVVAEEESEVTEQGDSKYPKAQGIYVPTKEQYEALKKSHEALSARVSRIEEHANIQAVA